MVIDGFKSLADLPTESLLRMLRDTERDAGPDVESTQILRRVIERRFREQEAKVRAGEIVVDNVPVGMGVAPDRTFVAVYNDKKERWVFSHIEVP